MVQVRFIYVQIRASGVGDLVWRAPCSWSCHDDVLALVGLSRLLCPRLMVVVEDV